jgi:hypothetical protein
MKCMNIQIICAAVMPLVLTNCGTTKTIDVDISAGKLTLYSGVMPIFTTPVQTAAKGIGDEIRSNKTPVGDFTITKEPNHRFGRVLRLSGYQGQRRGILIHKHFGSLNGTSGCVCPIKKSDMDKLFSLVNDGDRLRIRR